MPAAARLIVAVVAGIVVALALLVAVELWSAVVHPTPADFGGTTDQMCAHVANYPPWVLALVVPMWGFTAWLSAWVARKIGGRSAAWVVSVLMLAAVVLNVAMLPYPAWFTLACPIVVGAGAAFGSQLSVRKKAREQDA
ncbi:hypothetical protein Pla175_47880 [Pirellulimonas nuda]|uniref:Uncharacterized protein n=1 Tax=Pirellulimonas nuda TaxID=2528009 RepID=A0A518DIT5_9BACT|nr:hypothetical protein [Pirellulimonas nuda]QDU91366.1 hypothetical protein Pla175_47880 [Pirellulimonas nuda]